MLRGLPSIGAVALALCTAAGEARATGFAEHGRDLAAEPEKSVTLHGAFRVRGTLFYNLDLDRGPTPSGQLFFPVPLSDPDAQTLAGADMRLRTDLAVYAPGGGMAVKLRVDWLDNVALGGAPEGVPSATSTQRASDRAVTVKRAYGEALTPLGTIAAGRMGSHFGLGMLTNGGDCADCDSGDAADRIAFVTPLVDHLWAVAYDFSATGPFLDDRTGRRAIDVEPRANVHTLTAAIMHFTEQRARVRRRRAGKASFDYGVYVSHRWQDRDVPASFVPTARPVPIDARQVTARGYTATALDLWLRLVGPGYRVEAEGAYLTATVEQPSLIPGVELREPATSRQLGAALESEIGNPESSLGAGLDAGYASGDSAPGFGAFPGVNQAAPRAGDLDGPQAIPPWDTTVNNFRFHPDYRVDRILFREIIGTVTDAVYLRPHARIDLYRFASGRLTASLAAVASWAVNAESAPGQKRPLGVELDPTLAYASRDGFQVALEQATLFPLSGLDNRELGLSAEPAQLWRLRLTHGF
jgi:uncharacterized protein (TIGR04551 family)